MNKIWKRKHFEIRKSVRISKTFQIKFKRFKKNSEDQKILKWNLILSCKNCWKTFQYLVNLNQKRQIGNKQFLKNRNNFENYQEIEKQKPKLKARQRINFQARIWIKLLQNSSKLDVLDRKFKSQKLYQNLSKYDDFERKSKNFLTLTTQLKLYKTFQMFLNKSACSFIFSWHFRSLSHFIMCKILIHNRVTAKRKFLRMFMENLQL